MKPIHELIGDRKPDKPNRKTERGELLKYFAGKLGYTIPRVAGLVGHLKETRDLYYLKSICDAYAAEGKPWGKCFWGALKIRQEDIH